MAVMARFAPRVIVHRVKRVDTQHLAAMPVGPHLGHLQWRATPVRPIDGPRWAVQALMLTGLAAHTLHTLVRPGVRAWGRAATNPQRRCCTAGRILPLLVVRAQSAGLELGWIRAPIDSALMAHADGLNRSAVPIPLAVMRSAHAPRLSVLVTALYQASARLILVPIRQTGYLSLLLLLQWVQAFWMFDGWLVPPLASGTR